MNEQQQHEIKTKQNNGKLKPNQKNHRATISSKIIKHKKNWIRIIFSVLLKMNNFDCVYVFLNSKLVQLREHSRKNENCFFFLYLSCSFDENLNQCENATGKFNYSEASMLPFQFGFWNASIHKRFAYYVDLILRWLS